MSVSASAKLFVILSPVGPYYPSGWKPVKLLAEDHFVRAWPGNSFFAILKQSGGTGAYKLGSNYAVGLLPQKSAAEKGYNQVLWLSKYHDDHANPNEHYVTEVGTMNLFVYWINNKGEKELITAGLEDGTILPGVTRDSIIQLAKQWKEFKVTEGRLSMNEIEKAVSEGRILEAFGAGTAAVVSPIQTINFRGKDLSIPLNKNDPSAGIGPLAKRFAETIMSIQYGEIEHPWSVVLD